MGTLVAFAENTLCTGTRTVRNTASIDPADNFYTRRASFTAAGNAPQRFSVARGASGTLNYSFSLSDTTMYSPAWTTNGSFDTFYSFFNTTNAAINGVVTLVRTDGTVEGSTTLAIPLRREVSVHRDPSGQADPAMLEKLKALGYLNRRPGRTNVRFSSWPRLCGSLDSSSKPAPSRYARTAPFSEPPA